MTETPQERSERMKRLRQVGLERRKAENDGENASATLNAALSRVAPSRRASVERRCAEMPVHCRKTYLRAVGGKSIRAAVTAQCLECMGWDRAEVTRCSSPACSLFSYRPYQGKTKKEVANP